MKKVLMMVGLMAAVLIVAPPAFANSDVDEVNAKFDKINDKDELKNWLTDNQRNLDQKADQAKNDLEQRKAQLRAKYAGNELDNRLSQIETEYKIKTNQIDLKRENLNELYKQKEDALNRS